MGRGVIFAVLGMLLWMEAWTQELPPHARPIFGADPDSVSFYDRLDHVLKGKKLSYQNRDSSFDWMVGCWSIKARGFARAGFRGRTEFQWEEADLSFMRDQNHTLFVSTRDSILISDSGAHQLVPLPPQVILQYDVYGKVWVLQSAYNNRYDWGSLISRGWEGDHIEFRGTISLTGIQMIEKEIWTRVSDNEFRIVYKEKLKDGSWFTIEENTCTRKDRADRSSVRAH